MTKTTNATASTVITCDRCGNSIKTDHHPSETPKRQEGWLTLTAYDHNMSTTVQADLCINCVSKFNLFMDSRGV